MQDLNYYLKQLATNFYEYSFCCHFLVESLLIFIVLHLLQLDLAIYLYQVLKITIITNMYHFSSITIFVANFIYIYIYIYIYISLYKTFCN